jgi:hypothetical protein
MALEWGGTYWGGGVAMLGGALTFGGLRHLLNRPRTSHSVLLAFGLAVMANSRPFEGLVASLPVLAVLVWWLLADQTFDPRTRLTRVVAPMLAVLGMAAAGMAYYNYRVTGNPWTLPYQAYMATRTWATPFVWQVPEPKPRPESRSPENGANQETVRPAEARSIHPVQTIDTEWWFSTLYLRLLTHRSHILSSVLKVATLWAFYFGPILSVPLLALFWGVGDRWNWFAIVTGGLTLLAVLLTTIAWPNYVAPAAPLVFVVAVQGSRQLGLCRGRADRVGRHWIPTMLVLSLLYLILLTLLFPPLMKELRWGESRAKVQAELERVDGRHLVLVRYNVGHVWYKEWVQNKADIDGAKVVWARELAPDSNRMLLEYFKDRHAWLLEPDREPPILVPYDLEQHSRTAPFSR